METYIKERRTEENRGLSRSSAGRLNADRTGAKNQNADRAGVKSQNADRVGMKSRNADGVGVKNQNADGAGVKKRDVGRTSVKNQNTGRTSEEKLYEVLKFVEHGGYCRQSIDCVTGLLLIDRMKNEPVVNKAVLFEWFRKIAVCADQYERCGAGTNYRYLNPYGLIVSEEGEIFLLDTEVRGNAEVMKQMQKRAVRSHFIRPVYEMESCKNRETDLFSYGNTVRFLLAYMTVEPKLTHREMEKLSRMTAKCIGETKRRYENFGQILKDIPIIRRKECQPNKKYDNRASDHNDKRYDYNDKRYDRDEESDNEKNYRKKRNHKKLWIGIAAFTAVCLVMIIVWKEQVWFPKESGENVLDAEETPTETLAGDEDDHLQADNVLRERGEERESDVLKERGEERESDVLKERGKERENDVLREDRNLMENEKKESLSIAWKLADAYEKRGMKQEQIELYREIIELEQDPSKLEEAGIRKMKLEAETGHYERAIETGRRVLERLEESERIEGMVDGYAGEVGTDVKIGTKREDAG